MRHGDHIVARADQSSPSRGTWIEIVQGQKYFAWGGVVPLTGDVD